MAEVKSSVATTMRRRILLAFALGAAAALVSAYAGYILKADPQEPPKVVRTVFAPHLVPVGDGWNDRENLALVAGEIIRGCGLTDFRINIDDLHGFHYELDITPNNLDALSCVEKKAPKLDQSIELGYRVVTP